eukprot:gnl/MRDRNA2_/MRDRNA2_150436_c0_seq1.p1 gnl/MRDRNA2_/MRDRNA2_150436_c0~~gnl/MRDRNA2_/MRDRNA2_150436_c0_seq1.p1  ORF type:complete len:199 (+),score=21.01 gnl/MRDRNA2_/MRDRNA2_150436_c0_seq1:77-673(+)
MRMISWLLGIVASTYCTTSYGLRLSTGTVAENKLAKGGACMLTLAHPGDLIFLAARLRLQKRFRQGSVPPTVVVRDQAEDQETFCKSYDVCYDNDLHFLALRTMIGENVWNQMHHIKGIDVPNFNALNRTDTVTQGCFSGMANSPGRNYQALKKFYGPFHGPPSCESYFVSDCESFPFRPYDFNKPLDRMNGYNLVSV